ncbi:MAG: LamG-like jellyroll fold domain-containing protein [Bacteroidota bacterium]
MKYPILFILSVLGLTLLVLSPRHVNAQTYTEATFNQSIPLFKDRYSYIECGNIIPTESYTKEAWVYLDRKNGKSNNIMSGTVGTPSANAGHVLMIGSGNEYKLSAGHGGDWQTVIDDTEFPTRTWTHVAVSYNHTSGTMILYKNGVEVNKSTGAGSIEGHQELWLGSSDYERTHFFEGKLDEVRLWNDVRSATEIRDHYADVLTGNEEGLLAYYDFEQKQVGRVFPTLSDKSGQGKDGRLSSQIDHSLHVDGPNGTFDKALSFGPRDQYRSMGGPMDWLNIGNLGSINDWTIETWFKQEEEDPIQYIFHSDNGHGTKGVRVGIKNSNEIHVSVNFVDHHHTIPVTQSLSTWHHLAIVGDKTNERITIYFDGVPVNFGTDTQPKNYYDHPANKFPVSFPAFILGKQGYYYSDPSKSFKGSFDEFRIWNVARTKAEITGNMNSLYTGDMTNLLVYYDFNDNLTPVEWNENLTDMSSSTPNNGRLRNFLVGLQGAECEGTTPDAQLQAELFPIGIEGEMGDAEVLTDDELTVKVLFVDFSDAKAPTPPAGQTVAQYTSAIWHDLAGYQASNNTYLLEEEFKKMGLTAGINFEIGISWQEMAGTVASYEDWKEETKNEPSFDEATTPKDAFNMNQYVKDAHKLVGTGPFDEHTILVIMPHPDNDPLKILFLEHGVRESHQPSSFVYSGVTDESKGIRSNIPLVPTPGEDDDYRLMVHEMGHSFGTPDLYPVTGQMHEVGGFGMMGDSRSATSFLGWHLFRYGWLPKDRTRLLTKSGTYNIALKNISIGSGTSMFIVPDPTKYNKMWVVELGQEIRTGDIKSPTDGTVISEEGERVIVYTVEEPGISGKQNIRLVERIAPTDRTDFQTADWIHAYSYGLGQKFPSASPSSDAPSFTTPPFSFDVMSSETDGFTLCVTLPNDIEERNYPEKEVVGAYELSVSYDLDVEIVQTSSSGKIWDLKSFFPETNRSDHYIALRQNEIQLINKENMNTVVGRIPIDAPVGSKLSYKPTAEGKLQIVDKNTGTVYWENFPQDQTIGNFKLEFENQGHNINIQEGGSFKWGVRDFFKDKSYDTYMAFRDCEFQLINKNTQTVAERIQTNAPAGSKCDCQLTDEGKLQVVNKNSGTVYWENFPQDQTVGNLSLEFANDGNNIQLKENGAYKWDVRTRLAPFKALHDAGSIPGGAYFILENNQLRLKKIDDQSVIDHTDLGAGAEKWQLTQTAVNIINNANNVVTSLYTIP